MYKRIFRGLVVLCLLGVLPPLNAAAKNNEKTDNAVSVAVPAASPVTLKGSPSLDATAWSFHTGTYAGYGVLGGALQIGVAPWLRLSGGITGSLEGDQPKNAFNVDNYAFAWQFTGALMFMSTKIYKDIARPYSVLELTYYYDGLTKAGGVNGSFRGGIDFYMTDDYSVFVEAGVIAPFMREINAPKATGGTVSLGLRFYF